MLDLPARQLDLWLVRSDRAGPACLQRLPALLSPDERAQQARFRFEKDRQRYLLTRALVRDVLSRYLPVAPADWRFEADAFGKPHVVQPAAFAGRIAFNISHTEGLVVVAASRDARIGIDAENMQRHPLLEVAERFFAPAESRAMRRLPAAQQTLRFWELWTLKESYIKARGMGMSLPLDRFAFDLETPGGISLGFAAGFGDLASQWQFRQLRAGDHHLLAVCAEVPAGMTAEAAPPLRLTLREGLPLGRFDEVAGRIERCSIAVRPAAVNAAAAR